jgi:serine/threonine protein kinase/Tol biopolymer transport system component
MALSAGSRIGPYEIVSAIGAGGMGEVYRARDTKLNRDVAVKILLPAVAGDPDRLARFAREAQVLAAVNHPHIAHIYGLEDSTGVPALVMELVEGPTLQQRLEAGGLGLDEALNVARQIADALAAAHEQGIVHRDLKPANIKVKEDGTVKVLDFGLAKALDPATSPISPGVTASPTITTPAMMTGAGMILGTAGYMAPEQARGKAVDKRADIWAFGCVLYEMLAGVRPFVSEEISDTLALILTKEPDWSALPPSTPASIRRLLRRCLEKDRGRRLADIADVRYDIDEAIAAPVEVAAAAAKQTAPLWQRALPWGVAAAALVVAATIFLRPPPVPATMSMPVARVSIELGTVSPMANIRSLVVSPNGTTLAFVGLPQSSAASASPQLFTRRFDQMLATPIQGTDGAASPFFSPDSKWIAFFAAGKLKKVSVDGGAVVVLCELPSFLGGSWTDAGTIVFQVAPNVFDKSRLMQVPDGGGRPEPYPLKDAGLPQRWPQILPGGRAMLATVPASSAQMSFTDAEIVVQTLSNGERKVVQHGYFARYVPSGHLVYIRDGTLFAAPFDLTRLELTGAAVPVVESVRSDIANGVGLFSISDNGTLVYAQGETGGVAGAPIFWMDRSGRTSSLRTAATIWGTPRFSPDGRRLALTVAAPGQNSDIWIYEWDRDIATKLTTDPAADVSPIWSPDGRWIAYGSQRESRETPRYNIFVQRADGSGSVTRLTDRDVPQLPDSWSGNFIALHEGLPATGQDISVLPVERNGDSGWKAGTPMLVRGGSTLFAEANLSPDGKWIAYSTTETGNIEVFVQPVVGPGGRVQISSGGGRSPRWSSKRPEIVYMSNGRLRTVPYSIEGGEFHASKAAPWSDHAIGQTPIASFSMFFDLHPDGDRVAVALPPEPTQNPGQDKVVVVFNFFDELRKKAPTSK